MTPARSLAASVVALGFAGTIAAPLPAQAAPAPCERAENYAAQSGAEALRIDKLEIRAGDRDAERPATKEQTEEQTEEGTAGKGAADRILGSGAAGIDPTADSGEDADTLSEGIGILGEAVLDTVDPKGVIPRASSQPFAAQSSAAQSSAAQSSATESAAARPSAAEPESAVSGDDTDTGGQGGGGEMDDPKTVTVREVGIGEARTALIGTSAVKSAAIARILDGKVSGKASWVKPAVQQAPPSHATATTRTTAGGQAGPLKLGAGELSAHARWDAGMACGGTDGEAARSQSAVRGATILGGAKTELVRVPEKLAGVSTTAVEGRGKSARSVASATVTAGRIELAGGRVKVRVLKPPSLVASMSASEGGEVRYEPTLIEVSGAGIATTRLSAAGQTAEFTLKPDRRATEGGLLGSGLGDLGSGGLGTGSALPLPHIPGVPAVTMPPAIGGKSPESASAAGSTRVRIALGELRKATKGQAVAARATAVTVSLEQVGAARDESGHDDQSGSRGNPGYGRPSDDNSNNDRPGDDKPGCNNPSNGKPTNGKPGNDQPGDDQQGNDKPGCDRPGDGKPACDKPSDSKPGDDKPNTDRPGNGKPGCDKPGNGKPGNGKPGNGKPGSGKPGSVSLDLALGLMEAAAVAPERQAPSKTADAAAGLPITGPRVIGLAAGGAALLVTGVIAVLIGMRRRRTRQ
ncbi:hypothetical protein [Actinoplanes sp. NPDC026619]|uniref:hypothetical protein n=1 Tax=Actinoplanes sp. NPDC026619 TaxID=3155798 RepID=UPI0033FAA2A3